MKKKIKFFILITYIFFINQINLSGDEFYFEGEEIQILDEGNRLVSKKGVKITTNDGLILEGEKFEYDKTKLELNLSENIIINDQRKNIIIKTNKIKYSKKNEKLTSYNFTEVFFGDKYLIKSENIIFDRKEGIIKSNTSTSIIDNYQNEILSEDFNFFIEDRLIKAKNVLIKDNQGNETILENFVADLSQDQFYGKDVKINFNKNIFGNLENDPRLYGNSISSTKNKSEINKGVFTTCKKRDDCPPWELKAEKIIHDKNKKIINYKNAWLQVYDRPIFYFPRFFHPDPTVKRQSGFLIPNLSDSGNTGTSLSVPYFKVLAVNKDLTFKPRIFANRNLLLQNEYRHVEKNFDHIMDIGLFTTELNNKNESSKSHFFSNTNFSFENNFFENANLEINFEQVTNDTYLKKFKPSSELIDNENLMHNFFKLDGYNEDASLSIEVETFEDLTKNRSDRYEYIYPNIDYSKEFTSQSIPGSFNLSSNFYQKQFDTNKYTSSLVTDLIYNAETRFSNTGMLKDFQVLFKNPNTINKTGSNNESNTETKLLTKLMYSLTYPLKKEGVIYDRFLKPSLSLRFSPNNTKNISTADRVVNINNINSFNRLSISDGVEGGQSLTAGLDYKLKSKSGEDKVSINLAQVYRDEANPDLPSNSTLNNKYSDIIGNVKFNLLDNLSFEYDFIADNNFNRLNYNLLNTSLSVNNFVTSFEYLEERGEIGTKSYIKNQTKYLFDENNSMSFATRRNRELEMTEFYNLVYQYENDCLKAAIEYNKNFYSDTDIDPEEELLFTLTIVPFSKISSTNINK